MSQGLGPYSTKSGMVLNEDSICDAMEYMVEPYLETIGEKSLEDGIYMEFYGQTDRKKGTVVVSHGFCESADKYHELAYYLHRQGYQVALPEHRGHGRSLREVSDKSVVYVSDFDQYIADLHGVIENRLRARAEGGPLYLYAHSMGGCIGILYLEKYPHDFQKAVLSSPMLGVNTGGTPMWMVRLLCGIMVALGKGKKMVFNGHAFSEKPEFEYSGGESEQRYLHYLQLRRDHEEFQTDAASYGWLQEAVRAGERALRPENIDRITTPILLCSAKRDFFVEREPQKRFMEGLADGRMVEPDTRHEIYRGGNLILQEHLEDVFGFLQG